MGKFCQIHEQSSLLYNRGGTSAEMYIHFARLILSVDFSLKHCMCLKHVHTVIYTTLLFAVLPINFLVVTLRGVKLTSGYYTYVYMWIEITFLKLKRSETKCNGLK